MIKYECNEGKTYLDASGSIEEISADVALLICILNEKVNKAARVKINNAFWLGVCDAVNHSLTDESSPFCKRNNNKN